MKVGKERQEKKRPKDEESFKRLERGLRREDVRTRM